jgi:hypothetical protein
MPDVPGGGSGIAAGFGKSKDDRLVRVQWGWKF